MSEKPILFSGEMIKAILDGRKCMTRRVFKPRCECGNDCEPQEMSATTPEGWQTAGHSGRWWCAGCAGGEQRCPYGQPGDTLWVRESFRVGSAWEGANPKILRPEDVYYKADDTFTAGTPWRTAIFMPRNLARLTLRVTDVRVEQLWSISNEDARAEGVDDRDSFRFLWDVINKARGYGWNSNPWVYVVSFKKL